MDAIPGWTRGDFSVTCDQARFDFAVVHGFLTTSYWSPGIPRETVEKAVRNSLAFGLFAGDRQIGMALVVTDYATYGYLADVFVLDEFRGQGLGKWLMECVVAHPELQGLRRFGLVTRDGQGLYARFGFRELANPGRHMEMLRPDIYLATRYLATRPPSTIK